MENSQNTGEITSGQRRCPKCMNLSLRFDPDKKRIHCTECAYEEYVVKGNE